jgi:glycerate 2-kinase
MPTETDLRRDLLTLQRVALDAVDPYAAVTRRLVRVGETLCFDGRAWPNAAPGGKQSRLAPRVLSNVRVRLISLGKAAVPMAAAAADILGDLLSSGIVVTKYGHVTSHRLPANLKVIEAGHPIPDAEGLRAGQEVVALLGGSAAADDARRHDLVLALLSGGASALLPAPVPGLDLQDLQETTDLLLRAGATIVEMNAVRKHLSQLKGGQLARLAQPAHVATLVLSDVVGDPLDVIASGPTAPDPTTYGEALSILARYGLTDQVPAVVLAHLAAGAAGELAETPKADDPLFERVLNTMVGSNRMAAEAVVAKAQEMGYHSLLLTTFIEGEAREIAKVAVACARSIRAHAHPLTPPACLVWGGETTVTVRGKGKGGRNQELALAAALGLEGMGNLALMALATDGTDGPTDAAGAIVDGSSIRHARDRGWDPQATLRDNNAYPLLDSTGDLLRIGPTGTNVNDLLVLLVA